MKTTGAILGWVLVMLSLLGGCASTDETTTDGDRETGEESPADGDGTPDGDSAEEPPADGDGTPADGDADENGETEEEIATATNYLILFADALQESAAAFRTYRESTGYRVEIRAAGSLKTATEDFITGAKRAIRETKEELGETETLFVLLLGDAPDLGEAQTNQIPAILCENLEGDCFTDNLYADFDGDTVPEAAIGRVPAHDNAEALAYLEKVQRHESTYRVGSFNRRVVVYTGQANFSPEVDAALEMAVMKGLDRVSYAWDIVGVYANPTSHYFYTPLEEKVVELFNLGSVLTIYIGHGSADWTEGLTFDNLDEVHCDDRAPVSFFFACSNGFYIGETDSIAEAVIWKEDGAIASLASSDISHPYGNALWAYEIQRAALNQRWPTIGEVILKTKDGIIHNTGDSFRKFIDSATVASGQVVEEDMPTYREQHNNLYNLFGDPAVEMRYPSDEITITVSEGDMRAGRLVVSGSTPGLSTGTAQVSLEAQRDAILSEMEEVDPENPDPEAVARNWAKATNKVVTQISLPVEGGAFGAELTFDPDLLPLNKDFYIKAYVENGTEDRMGVAPAPAGEERR